MKKIVWMLFAAAAWTGCGDDNGADAPVPEATLELSAERLTFDADGRIDDGSAAAVTVTSSGEWRLGGRQLWCVPSAVSGADGDEVTFTVEPNTSVETRTVTFTFMCGAVERQLQIVQHGDSELDLVGGDRQEFGPEGGDVSVKMLSSSETSFRFEPEVDWLRQVVDEGGSVRAVLPSYLYFTVDPNTSGRDRETCIVIANTEGDERRVTVRQERNLLLELLGEATFEVPVEGQQIDVRIRSNIKIAVASDEWITLQGEPDPTDDLIEQTLSFRIAAADVPFRTGQIRITSPVDETLSIEIAVVQGQRPQGVHFPDEVFRQLLIDNGYVTLISGDECQITEKGESATTLPSLYYKGIASMQGIEAFKNLVDLGPDGLMYNKVTELDLSGNPSFTTLYYSSTFSGKRSYLERNPIEKLILGDAPIKDGYVYLAYLYNSGIYAQSVTVSGTKVLTVDVSLTPSDQVKWLDVTGCPNVSRVVLNSYYLKTLYVTQEQKAAIDARRLVIADGNYPTSTLQIVVR